MTRLCSKYSAAFLPLVALRTKLAQNDKRSTRTDSAKDINSVLRALYDVGSIPDPLLKASLSRSTRGCERDTNSLRITRRILSKMDADDPINATVWLVVAGILAVFLLLYPFIRRKTKGRDEFLLESFLFVTNLLVCPLMYSTNM